MTYTHCIDYIRKHKNIYTEELVEENYEELQGSDAGIDDIHEKILLEMKINHVKQILGELKAEERSLILMKYQDNMSIAELSETLKLGQSDIKMKLKRTRDKIRERYLEINPTAV